MVKKEKILSIIIPCYNSESYVNENINNLVKVSQDNQIEIIIINDGSTDKTLEKLKYLKKKYENIIIVNQENLGVSQARNNGLDIARGKYILFFDSDDSINEKEYKKVLELIKNNHDEELFVFSYFEGNKKDGYEKKDFCLKIGENNISKINELAISQKVNEPWKKIYLKSIIDKNKIRFDKKMFMGEDIIFFLEYLKNISVFYYYDIPYYYYFKNSNGACGNIKITFIEQEILVYKKIEEFINELKLDNKYKKINDILLLHITTRNIERLKRKKITNREIDKYLEEKKVYELFYNINYTSIKDKVRKFLLIKKKFNTIKIILSVFKG